MIRKLFLYTDLFAEPVSFSIQGQTRFRTIWGAIISTILLILLLIILWSSVQDYEDGTIKKVLFSEIYESNSNYILNSDDFIFEVNISGPNITDQNFDKHIQISFTASNGSHDYSLLFNKSKLESQYNTYKYTLLPGQKFEIRNNISFRTAFKLVNQSQYVYGPSDLFKVEIKIQSSLINQQNAFETFIQQQNVILTKGLTKIVPIEVRRVKRQEFPEMFQFLPPPTHSFYSTILSEQVVFSDSSEQVNLLEIQVILNNIIQCYNIEKFGILDIMSGFGGIYQFIYTFILLILRPLNKIMQRYILITALFDFSDGKDIEIKQNNQKRNALSNLSLNSIYKSRASVKIQTRKRNSSFLHLKTFIQNATQKGGIPMLFDFKNSQIQQKIQSFFQQIQKELTLSLTNYIRYRFFSCLKRYQNKKKHLQFAETNIIRHIDIYYIIRKLAEIDKLKMLLLSNYQLKLFDYLPKQVIDLDRDFEISIYIQQKQQGLLQQEVPNFKQLIDASQAYQEISKTDEDNITNQRLMKIIDPDIIDLFKIQTLKTNENENKAIDYQSELKYSDRENINNFLPEDLNSQGENIQRVKHFTARCSKLMISELPISPYYDQSPNLTKTPTERQEVLEPTP